MANRLQSCFDLGIRLRIKASSTLELNMPVLIPRWHEWVEEQREPPDRKRMAHAALDAYEKLAKRKRIRPDELEPIVIAAKCPYSFVWEIGTKFILCLAETNSTAQNAIRDIVVNARKVNERFQMVAKLRSGLPESFCEELIRQALNDKGNRVREKAAEAPDRLHLKRLVPDLENRLQMETHPNAKRSLEFHTVMLRDGYLLENDGQGNAKITIREKDGWSSQFITQSDIDEGKLEEIIAARNCD